MMSIPKSPHSSIQTSPAQITWQSHDVYSQCTCISVHGCPTFIFLWVLFKFWAESEKLHHLAFLHHWNRFTTEDIWPGTRNLRVCVCVCACVCVCVWNITKAFRGHYRQLSYLFNLSIHLDIDLIHCPKLNIAGTVWSCQYVHQFPSTVEQLQ